MIEKHLPESGTAIFIGEGTDPFLSPSGMCGCRRAHRHPDATIRFLDWAAPSLLEQWRNQRSTHSRTLPSTIASLRRIRANDKQFYGDSYSYFNILRKFRDSGMSLKLPKLDFANLKKDDLPYRNASAGAIFDIGTLNILARSARTEWACNRIIDRALGEYLRCSDKIVIAYEQWNTVESTKSKGKVYMQDALISRLEELEKQTGMKLKATIVKVSSKYNFPIRGIEPARIEQIFQEAHRKVVPTKGQPDYYQIKTNGSLRLNHYHDYDTARVITKE